MRAGTLAFALGICLSLRIPFLPAVIAPLSCAAACLLGLAGLRWMPLSAAWLIGLSWGLWHLDSLEGRLLPASLEQADIWVSGQVAGLPRDTARSRRLDLLGHRWCQLPTPAECDRTASWQESRWKVLLSDYQHLGLRPGQQVQLQVRLKQPRGFANPGTFDYEAWLWEQGYQATGYVRQHEDNRIVSSHFSAGALRLALRERLLALSASIGIDHQGILLALGIGDRQGLNNRDWSLFSATGTTHLMVISGLHIGLMATLGYQVCLLLWRLLPGLPLTCPAPRAAAAAAILAALLYCLLAGFSLPTRRAFIMVLAFMGSRLLLRQSNPRNALGIALIVVLVLNPMAPVSAGFWLSFGAVAALLYCSTPPDSGDDRGKGVVRHVVTALRAQWALFFALLPLLMLHFQQLSLLAPLVNLLAIPLVGLLVVPMTLMSLLLLPWPSLSGICLLLADRLLGLLMNGLAWSVEAAPGLLVQRAMPGGLTGIALTGAALMVLFVRPWWGRGLALSAIPLLMLHQPPAPPRGTLVLHMLDVGQGMAMVLETADTVVVYDTGPRYSPRFDAGSGLLVPFLRSHGLVPDLVIVSHGDSDHAGGLPGLRRAWPTVPVISGEPDRLKPTVPRCRAGQQWESGGLGFAFIHPAGPAVSNSNDNSCLLAVSGRWGRLLLTGDIEAGVEKGLRQTVGEQLQADVMTVPHHGSSSSSTAGFLNAVAPQTALVSSGYLNRFGHPDAAVLKRYVVRGASVYNTAQSGYLRITLGMDAAATVTGYRATARRVWRSHHVPD